MVIIVVCIVLSLIIWLIGFFIANDFSVPTQNINNYKNILLIFPHADDEVLNAGGLINKFSQQGSKTTLVILTKGEKGTPDAHLDNELKKIRVMEAQSAQKLLGISNLIQEDFGDGELVNKKEPLDMYITELINHIQPDLIITYDLAGLYGHPDHIATSESVTSIIKQTYTTIPLWYISFPRKVLAMTHLPEEMAKDPLFKDKRACPDLKVVISMNIRAKIETVYSYKSQYQSFREGLPFKLIPMWFYYLMPQFEYFSKAN